MVKAIQIKVGIELSVMRTIATYFCAGVGMFVCLPYLYYINRLKKKIGNVAALEKINKLVNIYAKMVVKIIGAKVEVVGEEHIPYGQTAVYVGNHQSNFDIPVVVGYINQAKGFVVKAELGRVPLIRRWIKGLDCVLIDRGEGRKALEAILRGSKLVKSGYSMVIFPEGTRSVDGKLGEFKAGSLKLASKGGAMVVPFAIEGARDVQPKGKKIFRPARVKLTILPPIPAEEVAAMDTKNLAYQVKSVIAKSLGQEIEPIEEISEKEA